ncbi:MAG: hypothetical protein HQ507_02520 [Candidatus Marinimicrobia bacterium]|nr:hypothetical protein [Candidatus Neomarinimicrobiota bacterium]
MPELKYAKTRRLRRFEKSESGDNRIHFQRLTSGYPKRGLWGLLVMAGLVAYLLYYLSKV